MSTLRTTAATLALAVGATAGLAACSSDEKKKEAPKAKDAWNASQDTLGKYKTLEMHLTQKSGSKSVDVTEKGNVTGPPFSLTLNSDGMKAESIGIGKRTYVKGNSAYWTNAMQQQSGATSPTKVADKWVYADSETAPTGDFPSLIKGLRDDSDDTSKKLLSDKATVTEDKAEGKDAWKITSEDKKTTAWVSQDDARDLIKLVSARTSTASASPTATGSSSAAGEAMTATYVISSHDKDYGVKAPSGAVDYKTIK